VAFFGFAAANSFAQATWAGVQQAASQAGVQNTKFFDGNFNPQTQVSQIQDAITTGQYQVFVIQANDGNAVVPAVKQAIAKGIAVVAEFTPIGPNYDSVQPQVPGEIFAGESPAHNGVVLAQMAVQACSGINPCKVAYLEGLKALPLDNARTQAALHALKSASNVQVVDDIEGGYTAAEGLKAVQDVLSAHPDVNVIIGSTQAIEGGAQAVKAAGKLGKIKLIGNGASCQMVKAVLAGDWYGGIMLPVKTAGAKATQLGIQHAEGQSVTNALDFDQAFGNPMATKQNIQSTGYKADYCD
jgi:ribose transport system substrate-binding protein